MEPFDIVCALEVVEHVADYKLFLESCAELTRPGGSLFVSTMNKTPQSYAMAIVMAEYVTTFLRSCCGNSDTPIAIWIVVEGVHRSAEGFKLESKNQGLGWQQFCVALFIS